MISYVDMETVVAGAGFSAEISEQIVAILNHPPDKFPAYKGVRLLKFLTSLKTGEFSGLASKKRLLLENFTELLFHNDRSVSRICYLFFDQRHSEERPGPLLPEEMVKRLIVAGRTERVERIKALVWDLLLKQGDQLARLVSPEDIAFALWLDAPLTRSRVMMFMVRHFGADKAMQAVSTCTSKTGKRIPSSITRRFIEMAWAETQLKYRKGHLSNIIKGSELTREEIDCLWSDYLGSQNRFGLIRIFSSDSDAPIWMEDLKGGREQLAFDFRPAPGSSNATAAFASRIHAIRSSQQKSAQVF